MNTTFTTLLLASTTALAACGGGGGGGGGGLPDVGENNYLQQFGETATALKSQVNGASVSSLTNPTQEELKTAQDVINLIHEVDAYWQTEKAALADMDPSLRLLKLQSDDFRQAEAIVRLLKEDYLPLAQQFVNGQGVDATLVNKYSSAEKVNQVIETKKTEIFNSTAPVVVSESVASVEINSSVGANTNEREVIKSQSKGEEKVSGGTKEQIERTVSYILTTVYEKLFDRVTTVVTEDRKTTIMSDGSTKIKVIGTKSYTNTATLSAGTRSENQPQTKTVSHTVTVDNPTEEIITEDPIVNIDRSNTWLDTYTDGDGNLVTDTKVTPVKTTTVKRNKKVTDTKRSTYTYADGHTLVVDLDDVVTVTALDDVVTTEKMNTEIVDTKVEVQTVNEETTQETTVDVAEGEPVFVTTHEDKTTVVEADGNKTTTVTRYFTTTVTTTTTTTTTVQKTTVKTFSNGKTETIVHAPEVSVETKDTVVEDKFTKIISEVVEALPSDTLTVVDEQTVTKDEYWLRLDKEILTEEIKSSDTVIKREGNYDVTYRVTTFVTPETHTHVYATDTVKVITYSDGSKKEKLVDQALRFREPVTKYPVDSEREELLEIMRELAVVQDPEPENPTDTGAIGTDHVDMGTRTPGYNTDPASYRTDEFSVFKTTGLGNNHLEQANFDVAYSRGWTGKGSLVVVADTGADITHVDLDDQIAATVDYTGSGITNSSEHGTHVAGIIAAEKNDVGMHGAAFDAKLAIAKVADGYSYSFSNAQKAAAWGNGLGAVAINVSAEVRLDSAMKASIVKDAHGVWHSDHWYYGVNGYNGAVNEAVKWKAALGNEMVLVKAAGNAGTDYSAGMNQMATATDSNGNLILDGQMIIVGSYDRGNQYGNKAGTVCATYENGVCIDAAKIKDYYILADGYMVDSTNSGGGYVNYTGTSMAAPVVSGAIAVLHQMWPHMKGKHLVQLVLVTAKKDVRNSYGENVYDDDLHGQGMLDMDRATRPVGATGIPTSGRTDGGVSAISGGAAVSGVAASELQALTGVMVLDSFERDFYIDLGDMTQAVDTRTASVAEQMGAVNYFAPYLDSKQSLIMPEFELNENSSVTVGGGASTGHALGSSFQGTLGTTEGSTTMYANYNYQNGGFYAQAGVGVTNASFNKTGSMLVSADNIISSTATVGYEFAPKENTTWGFAVSQPVTVESAKMQYRVPTARTLDGRVVHEMRTVDFKSSEREVDLGTYYNFNMMGANVNTFAEVRTGVAALQKELEKRVGLNVQLKF